MRKVRTFARELSLNILYQVDGCNIDFYEALNTALENADFVPLKTDERINEAKQYTTNLVCGIKEHLDVDDIICKYTSEEWPFHRLAVVDKNILRIAIYEIMYCNDVDVAIAIDEGVKLAMKYSTQSSGRYINGLLAAFIKQENITKKGTDNGKSA